jgi:hypothetical protein
LIREGDPAAGRNGQGRRIRPVREGDGGVGRLGRLDSADTGPGDGQGQHERDKDSTHVKEDAGRKVKGGPSAD